MLWKRFPVRGKGFVYLVPQARPSHSGSGVHAAHQPRNGCTNASLGLCFQGRKVEIPNFRHAYI